MQSDRRNVAHANCPVKGVKLHHIVQTSTVAIQQYNTLNIKLFCYVNHQILIK